MATAIARIDANVSFLVFFCSYIAEFIFSSQALFRIWASFPRFALIPPAFPVYKNLERRLPLELSADAGFLRQLNQDH
jgi:hypothetical protein